MNNYNGLNVNKSVVLHGELGILVNVTYKKDFNLSKWLNEHLTEKDITDWINQHK